MLGRWLVLSLVLYKHSSSQPITEEKENVRIARQYDFVECCPCPGSRYSANEKPNASDLARSSTNDCPCRLREADSDGSPSIFSSKTLTPLRNFVSPVDSREDPKPLLHPEVGLASSVLETLREVTDEEYRDALARDAARSAARASDPDEPVGGVTEPAKNIVTIILNPKSTGEDVISPEASNVEETRLQPLESYQVRDSSNLLQGILLPKVNKSSPRKLLDLNNDASSIKERVEGINRGLEGLKLRANQQSKLFLKKIKPLDNANLNKFKLHSSKIPDLRLNPALTLKKPINTTNPLGDLRANKLPKLTIPRLRLNKARKTNVDTDNNPSPSNMQEQFLDSSEATKDVPLFRLKSLLPTGTNGPLSLKNLLNLKDVELIPSKLNTPTKLTMPKNNSNQEGSDEDNDSITATNIQVISKEKSVKTEILDAVPSPSENQLVVAVNDNSLEATTIKLEDDSQTADPCISDFHKTTDIADFNTKTEGVPKEDSNNDIETLTSEEESSVTEDEDQANKQQNQEDKNLGNLFKENTQSSDQDTAASSPAVTIQQVESFDYEDEDSERKEIDFLNQVNEKGIANSDFEREDCSDNVNNDQDSMTGASNNVVQIVPQENSEDVVENVFKTEDSCQDEEKVVVKSKIPLESIEEDNNISGASQIESLDTQDDEKSVANSSIEKENDSTELININESGEDADDSNQVNLQDLQQLSNSILDLSNKKKQKDIADTKNLECQANSDVVSLKTNDSVEQETDNGLIEDNSEEEINSSDLDQSATSVDTKILETVTSPTVSIEENDQTDTQRQEIKEINDTNDNSEIKTCLTNPDLSKSSSAQEIEDTVPKLSLSTDANEDEMTAEATAPLITVVSRTTSKSNKDNAPGSSQQHNAIVQPSSLFGGNGLDIFRRPILPLPKILNVNPKIPTLEEIQSSISSLFGMQERNAEDDDLSTEFDSSNDCSNRNTVMSSDASTRSSHSLLPPLKPLEDINIDIFQLSPSSQASSWTPKIPVLNLNSYKAKLAIPKSLDLKPMQFESALGNKGSLLGASFSVGPKRIGSVGKAKPRTKSGFNFNNNGLGNRLGKLPSIHDLKINTPRINPLGDHLRASQTISDNLRTHTENTMKNIQQSLASTLNEAKVRDVGILGTKLAKPQDLFEMVSTAHDDMNDKLKGIHYDLKDRLESLHEKIADQTRLPSLSIPVVSDKKFAFKPLSKMSSRIESKQPTPRMRALSKSLGKGIDFQRNPSSRVSKPQGTLRFSSPQTKTDAQKFKPFKISTAASSLTPKSVEVPKLTTMPSKYSFSSPLLRDSNVQLKETKSPLFAAKDQKKTKNKPNRVKNFKPFGETQVKISFSTTPRPSTQEKPTVVKQQSTTKPNLKKSERVTMPRNNLVRNRPDMLRRNFKPGDSKGFASEVRSSRIPSPINPSKSDIIGSGDADEAKGSSQLRESKLMPKGNVRVSPSRKTEFATGVARKVSENKPYKFKSNMQSWPSTTESAFLSKVREALKSRFTTANPSPTTEITSIVKPIDDMVRSASENNELVLIKEEPLRENVSYKCKMVCVKDP